MLLSPPQAGADHLKALARVSRGLRDSGFVAKLRGAGSPDALYALLTDSEARDAACSAGGRGCAFPCARIALRRGPRSEERRVGHEFVRTCRSRSSPPTSNNQPPPP